MNQPSKDRREEFDTSRRFFFIQMATNVDTDQEKAFDEAYALSGAQVTIDGQTVSAIIAREGGTAKERNSEGVIESTHTAEITVKTADLPTLAAGSRVTHGGIVYRIPDSSLEGKICTTLELESP